MLFDKIGRKFYSPNGLEDVSEGGLCGLPLPSTEGTIYESGKTYLNTEVAPPLFDMFPEFDDLTLTPYVGMIKM